MLMTYSIYLKIVARLSVNKNVTESQIRGYLADAKSKLNARLDTLIGNAPPVAAATLGDTSIGLKVVPIGPGLWELYPKMVLTVTVADEITELQVRNFLEGYWDQAKTDLRTLVGNVPDGMNATIVSWHVHRLSGDVDEVEI